MDTVEAAPEARMQVRVNGEPRQLPAGCTVADLLERLAVRGPRIAVAVNRDVLPRSRFGAHRLAEGDRVEILEAVGGG